MNIRVIGSNMDVGVSLTAFVEEHLQKDVKKYFENAVSADVYFAKQRNNFTVNINVNEGVKGGGIVIKSNAQAGDVYGCFNEALEKVVKQLRRYKRKIKNYRRERGGLKSTDINNKYFEAPKYVLAMPPHDLLEESEQEEVEDETQTSFNIINEKTTEIEELTVDQAIMKMDLSDLPALVFINKNNKRLNIVYYRKDGNISWIDPKI